MDQLRRWVAGSISASMTVAMVVVASGVLIGLIGGQGLEVADQGEGLFAAIGQWSPGAIVLLGIFLLTLTPVAHIGAALAAFARGGERRYLLIALAVGSVLLGSLAVAMLAGRG